MKFFSVLLLLFGTMALSTCANSCDPVHVNDNANLPANPGSRHGVEINLSPFIKSVPKLIDQSIQDIQIIDDETVLFLGACPPPAKNCYLQVLGPDGTHPFILNADLSKYGQPIAISNIVDGRVVVAMESLSDDYKNRSLKLVTINHGLSRISKIIDFIPDSSDGVFSADGTQLRDEEANLHAVNWLEQNYSRALRSYRLILSDNHKLILSERIREHSKVHQLDLESEELTTTSLLPHVLDSTLVVGGAASIAEVEESGNLVVVANVTREEARILAKRFLDQDFQFVGYTLPVLFLIATDGTLITAQPVKLPWQVNFGNLEIAGNGKNVIVGGTALFDGNVQKPFLCALSFDSATKHLTQVWARTFEFSRDSEFLSDLYLMQNGSILFGGGTGFRQVRSGSVLQANDCFLSLVNKDGQLLGWHIFGTPKSDFVSFIRKSKQQDRPFVMTHENGALTHEEKMEPFLSGSYWVDLGK